AVAVRHESDAVACSRPSRAVVAAGYVRGDHLLAGAVGVHHLELKAGGTTQEGDARAVGREGRARGVTVVRSVEDARTVRVHHEHVAAAIAVAGEGDARAVGRPDGAVIGRGVVGQVHASAA